MRKEPTREMCRECGARCCKAPNIIRVNTAELRRLKALPGGRAFTLWNAERFVWQGEFAHMRGGRCPFLGGDDACTIYAERPWACRTYPTRPERCCPAWPEEE